MPTKFTRFIQKHTSALLETYFKTAINTSAFDNFVKSYYKTNKIGSKQRQTIYQKAYNLMRYDLLLNHILKNKSTYSQKYNLVNTSEFYRIMENQKLSKFTRVSFPKILFNRIVDSYQDEEVAFNVCKALNTKAQLVIRINPNKTTRRQLLRILINEYKMKVQQTQFSPLGINIVDDKSICLFQIKQFENGLFQIQDEGSQIAALTVNCRPGQTVLDYCAGSGGKSLAIAHLLQGKGQIFLHDIRSKPLENAKKRFLKSGNENVQFHTNQDKLKQMIGKFDWIILDVPCTGVGTIRRNPQIKYKFTEQFLKNCVNQQNIIFNRAIKYLKPKGKIVYITCSILKQQNQQQISNIIKTHGMRLVQNQILKIMPQKYGMDGFFAAVLQYDN